MAITVNTFAELKSAIESATETDILVAADITFAAGGARVNVAKSNLVIDFDGHTVTDYNNLSVTDTIYIPSSTAVVSVTIKNAIWSGRNYYGVVGVYDGNTNSTITLQNITYTGPQFVYNKNGTTNLVDCTVTLDRNGSSANPQEFCEANRLSISGTVSVVSGSTSNAVVWFTGTGASLTVLQNAKFTVEALSTYFAYTDVAPTMVFEQNSATTITTKGGLYYAASSSAHIASSFWLKENASFVAYKKGTGSAPMFKCLSSLQIDNNADFELYTETSNTSALVYFGQVANVKITTPKRVVLYNSGRSIFSFQTGSTANPNVLEISTQMLRLWTTAKAPLSGAGGLDDLPASEFFKANYATNLTLTIKATNSTLVSTENNLASGDQGYPLTTTSLNFFGAQVFALGSLNLTANKITDQTTAVSGTANSLASIKVAYESFSAVGSADEAGNYAVTITEQVPVSTLVTITANKKFLSKSLTVLSEGSIWITAPRSLVFTTFTTSSNLQTIYRANTDFSIELKDTRTEGADWYLYCHIAAPLTSKEDKLEKVLSFTQDGAKVVLTETPTLVYSGKWSETEKTHMLTWEKAEGFLLNINPQTVYASGKYTTDLFWTATTEKIT